MANIVPIEQVQAGLITYLKSLTSLTNFLGSSTEIREFFWQGEKFTYPNIRLQMGTSRAEGEPNCNKWLLTFYILCFSDQKTSKEAAQLASIVGSIHGKQPGLLNGVNFTRIYVDQMVPPIRQDELTWRSEVICHSTITL